MHRISTPRNATRDVRAVLRVLMGDFDGRDDDVTLESCAHECVVIIVR